MWFGTGYFVLVLKSGINEGRVSICVMSHIVVFGTDFFLSLFISPLWVHEPRFKLIKS